MGPCFHLSTLTAPSFIDLVYCHFFHSVFFLFLLITVKIKVKSIFPKVFIKLTTYGIECLQFKII